MKNYTILTANIGGRTLVNISIENMSAKCNHAHAHSEARKVKKHTCEMQPCTDSFRHSGLLLRSLQTKIPISCGLFLFLLYRVISADSTLCASNKIVSDI